MNKKLIVTITAIVLVLCCAVGGTIAYIQTTTGEVVNTFTIGDINITLAETTGTQYKMVPGNNIAKDPKVTVKAKSEACWLFVKVDKSANFDTFMSYEIATGWTELTAGSGIYYREVAYSTTDSAFAVLKDNKVSVKDSVTKEMFTAETFTNPTLTFKAYAIQKDNIASATLAWQKLSA